MKATTLDRRRGDTIAALGRTIIAEQPFESSRGRGETYQSRAVVELLLDDESTWYGCTRCSVVASESRSVVAHQKAHPVAKATKRRQARRVTTTVEEESSEEETVEVPTPGQLFGGRPDVSARRAARPARPGPLPSDVPAPVVQDPDPAPAPRDLTTIVTELQHARDRVLELEREAGEALRADWRNQQP